MASLDSIGRPTLVVAVVHFPFALSPRATSRRMASGREGLGLGCVAIHASTAAKSGGGIRSPIC